jgi:hypothetical protein
LEFDKNVKKVLDGLSRLPNLISTGRNGLFLNTDMHDSMEMGLLAADEVSKSDIQSGIWYDKMETYIQEKIEG